MFEPSRVAPACVVQAYERVVPITRRAPPTAGAHSRSGRERPTQRVGRRHTA